MAEEVEEEEAEEEEEEEIEGEAGAEEGGDANEDDDDVDICLLLAAAGGGVGSLVGNNRTIEEIGAFMDAVIEEYNLPNLIFENGDIGDLNLQNPSPNGNGHY